MERIDHLRILRAQQVEELGQIALRLVQANQDYLYAITKLQMINDEIRGIDGIQG